MTSYQQQPSPRIRTDEEYELAYERLAAAVYRNGSRLREVAAHDNGEVTWRDAMPEPSHPLSNPPDVTPVEEDGGWRNVVPETTGTAANREQPDQREEPAG